MRMREGWNLTLSKCKNSPRSGWLYNRSENAWVFSVRKYNRSREDSIYHVRFEYMPKREVMKRCVAILGALNKLEK